MIKRVLKLNSILLADFLGLRIVIIVYEKEI